MGDGESGGEHNGGGVKGKPGESLEHFLHPQNLEFASSRHWRSLRCPCGPTFPRVYAGVDRVYCSCFPSVCVLGASLTTQLCCLWDGQIFLALLRAIGWGSRGCVGSMSRRRDTEICAGGGLSRNFKDTLPAREMELCEVKPWRSTAAGSAAVNAAEIDPPTHL